MAVVLGGQGERRRVREEGRVPGLLHRCLSGCCWVPWNAVFPGAINFWSKMPKIGSRQAQRGQLDTPHFPTLTIPWLFCFAPGQG